MLKKINLSLQDDQDLLAVAKALDSPIRLDILKLLNASSLNVKEIAETLNQPASSTAYNIDILQESGLIITEMQYHPHGQIKLCSRNCDAVSIDLFQPGPQESMSSAQHIPIGSYFNYEITAPCGIVTPSGNIGHDDEPDNFFDANRHQAGLLWFSSGYVEYRVNKKTFPKNMKSLEISFEACSEAPFYRNDWKSDITLWLNGVEVTTWTSPGDFGGRPGKQNPEWWSKRLTQFGILNHWTITADGTYINNIRCGDCTLNDLALDNSRFITLRIGIKSDAKYCGGINLFGSTFGDYNQDIIVLASW